MTDTILLNLHLQGNWYSLCILHVKFEKEEGINNI